MEQSSLIVAPVSETVQSDSDDPFSDFEDFCLRISESDISYSSDKENNKKQDIMIDSVKMIEAAEPIKCNGDVNKKIENIEQEQVQNGIDDYDSSTAGAAEAIKCNGDVNKKIKNIEESDPVQNGIVDYDSSPPGYDGSDFYEEDDEEGKECVIKTDEKIIDSVIESLITQIEFVESLKEDEEREKLLKKIHKACEASKSNSSNATITEFEEEDETSDMDIEPEPIHLEATKPVQPEKRTISSDSESEEKNVKKPKNDTLTFQKDEKIEKLTNGIKEDCVETSGPSKPSEISETFDELSDGSKISVPELNDYVEGTITEWIADTGLVGHERTEYNQLKLDVVKLKTVIARYQKQYDDVKKIIRKMIEERKTINGNARVLPPPAKVTRSVGLQVSTVGRRTMLPLGSQTPKVLPPNRPTKSPNTPTSLPRTQTGQIPPQNARKSTSMSQLQRRLQGINKPVSDTETSQTSVPSSVTSAPSTPSEPRPSTSRVDVVDLTDADEEVVAVNSNQIQIMSSNGEYKSQSSGAISTDEKGDKTQAKKTQEIRPAKNRSLPRLPSSPFPSSGIRPPKPILRLSRSVPSPTNPAAKAGIMLCWNFTNEEAIKVPITKYQVFAYQEGVENGKEIWKKVGDVRALPLPMACTLTQFKEGFKYYFAVRAVDQNMTMGEFSLPGSIRLNVFKKT